MNAISVIVRSGMSYFTRLGPQGWFLCFVIVMVAGVVWMRGFGSRSNY